MWSSAHRQNIFILNKLVRYGSLLSFVFFTLESDLFEFCDYLHPVPYIMVEVAANFYQLSQKTTQVSQFKKFCE